MSDDSAILDVRLRHIYKNFDDMQITMAQLKYEIDILILTECWINPNKNIPQIPNYTSFQTKHHCNQSDGVVAYIHKKHSVTFKEIILENGTGIQLNNSNHNTGYLPFSIILKRG